ncbi:hypothetical protein TNIN_106791 [Trichonephila inaurata madagascariensis]|uniref:Uncharacterized protein n=1 Tax=Trichonephila inaurata madagascariensis TaxID=2747483 RepID=A0A8X6YTQ3_9ARAC|nr:hypothetical protein TNIN_106791 [Trichonephila inaurata madagascariensis]
MIETNSSLSNEMKSGHGLVRKFPTRRRSAIWSYCSSYVLSWRDSSRKMGRIPASCDVKPTYVLVEELAVCNVILDKTIKVNLFTCCSKLKRQQ